MCHEIQVLSIDVTLSGVKWQARLGGRGEAEQCAHYDGMATSNRKTMGRNSQLFNRAVNLALGSVGLGGLAFFWWMTTLQATGGSQKSEAGCLGDPRPPPFVCATISEQKVGAIP